MENKEFDNGEEIKENEKPSKVKSFFSGLKNKVSGVIKNAKDSYAEKKAEKALEERIQKAFNERKTCQTMDCIVDKDKPSCIKVTVDVDYDNMRLILYGENKRIDKRSCFVDKAGQIFAIKLIKLNQEVEIEIGGEVYKRQVTVFDIQNETDERKIEGTKTVINNTNVNISGSNIKGSNVGGNNDY